MENKTRTHHTSPTTYLGIRTWQEWQDLGIWEMFFDQNPVKTFIELGTGPGGSSLYFALQCYRLGIPFHTFDNQVYFDFDEEDKLPKVVDLMGSFQKICLWKEKGVVDNIIKKAEHPIVMFFDNGDKPKEWAEFAPKLDPGDFCAVHDWGVEFFEKDIGDVAVERILTKPCEARKPGWTTMWFRRIDE
jgi:cephalosporin hydroxylase